jgi:hypothetical protein
LSVVDEAPPRSAEPRALAPALLAFLGLLSVAPLLAWVLDLGSFQSWFRFTTVPAVLMLTTVGVIVVRRGSPARLRTALVAGCIGGLLGTVGYDLFRVPFAAAGLRVFAPIESYGVLITGADSSSPWTSFVGWSFHFSNGIGFGIAYAMVGLGRRWQWGVVWGLVLETATIVTPFATLYGLAGKPNLIALAYAAHVAYGYPLGVVVERAGAAPTRLAWVSPRTAAWALLALLVGLLIWHRPFQTPSDVRAGQRAAPGPSAIVGDGRFRPEWLRVPVGGCAVIRNIDPTAYTLKVPAIRRTELPPKADMAVCFDKAGVFRVRTSKRAYSGGFVIVDEHDEREAASPVAIRRR